MVFEFESRPNYAKLKRQKIKSMDTLIFDARFYRESIVYLKNLPNVCFVANYIKKGGIVNNL